MKAGDKVQVYLNRKRDQYGIINQINDEKITVKIPTKINGKPFSEMITCNADDIGCCNWHNLKLEHVLNK